MPSPILLPVKAHVSPLEKEAIQQRADNCNMTVSAYARRLLTGQPLPNVQNQLKIKELLNTAADLARLGNLFKLALDDDDFNMLQKRHGKDALTVMQEIQANNEALKRAIKDLIKK
ncbi:MAG: hypothetical protein ABJN40_23075 [Sneathiella sp.]